MESLSCKQSWQIFTSGMNGFAFLTITPLMLKSMLFFNFQKFLFPKECRSGRYGIGCRNSCSSGCAGSGNECDPVDGTCKQGCDPGYRDRRCHLSKKLMKLAVSINNTIIMNLSGYGLTPFCQTTSDDLFSKLGAVSQTSVECLIK